MVRGIRNSTYRNPDGWFLDWFWGGQQSDSGVMVSPQTALHYAPYFQAVNRISGDLGKIPFPLYKRTPDGRERDTRHRAYRLMMFEPNEAMASDVFRQTIQSHALSWGNGRAVIIRNEMMEPEGLVPLLPDRTETKVIDGQVVHITKINESMETRAYLDRDVLHIKGLGADGLTGYSVASMARNSLGLGMAAEKHGNRLFKNNAVPSIVLEADGRVTPEDAKLLLADFEKWHSGLENAGRPALAHSGLKIKPISMPSDDAQWLETRKFQRVEVASWFNMPPHKLGDSDNASYNSLEQENQSYLTDCLLFWFVRWQLECRRKLLSEREKESDSHYFEFLADALVSVDFGAKVQALNTLVAATVISPNEARDKLNMNHREGGDTYQNPNTSRPQETKIEPERVQRKPRMPTPDEVVDGLLEKLPERIMYPLANLLGNDERLKGERGPAGPQGDAGPQGEPGEPGKDGADGFNGKDGIDGINGRDGIDGRGITGTAIDDGVLVVTYSDDSTQVLGSVVGPAGRNGMDGQDGKDGLPGEPSLYGRCLDVLSASISQEVSVVRHHAAKAKNFMAWFERWYPTWQEKLAADIVRLGADGSLAAEHCTESVGQLSALIDRSTMSTLAGDVEALTATWHERGVILARRIAGGELPNAALELSTMVSTPHGLGRIAGIDAGWRYSVELQDGTVKDVGQEELEVIG